MGRSMVPASLRRLPGTPGLTGSCSTTSTGPARRKPCSISCRRSRRRAPRASCASPRRNPPGSSGRWISGPTASWCPTSTRSRRPGRAIGHAVSAAVDGVDVLFVGPLDLTTNMGIQGEFEHPAFVEARRKVCQAARNAGKAAGILATAARQLPTLREEGYTVLDLGSDRALRPAHRGGVGRRQRPHGFGRGAG